MVSGIDLLAGDQSMLEATLNEKVVGIGNVTHVYFFAYLANSDQDKEVSINAVLLERAILAVEKLSKSMKFVVVPTGTKVRLILSASLSTNTSRLMEFICLMLSLSKIAYH
jgi:hypothetical protein